MKAVRHPERRAGKPVRVSVIIPTFNRVEILERVLRAWERQAPDDLHFEVIVVDDGSEDQTSELLSDFRASRYALLSLRQENQGPAAARNAALTSSTGDYVLFSGDDIEPAPDLLKRHLEAHRERNDSRWAVLGKVEWAPDLELTTTMCHVDGVGAQQFSYRRMTNHEEYDFRHFYTSNVSVSRSLVETEPGGFSTDFPAAAFEDAEYAYRLSRHGMRIVYCESARAWHHHSYDAGSFFARQIACGNMAAILMRKWPQTQSLIGGNAVKRGRLRMLFALPSRRRLMTTITQHLEGWEERAINLASAFDRPVTSIADPLLEGLFQYAYLKGLSSATVPRAAVKRLRAFWFLQQVGGGIRRLEDRLCFREPSVEADSLASLLEPFRDVSILSEDGNRFTIEGM
jgi:glycosyltransferase involved in cell wall biosynthesis